MSLAQLPASTIKLITSSQIITSVSSAVKELIENALDASASSVDVKLVNFGIDRIEVKDNGLGIGKENIHLVALPHYTSKITEFRDLESLQTYGFRGEALNALCRVGQVTITTATSEDSMATVYTLDSSGIISASKPAPHVLGTTVLVTNLFKNLPVRRQIMGSSKRAQEELKVIEAVVKSFAVIKANVRVTLSHNKCLIWQKTPCLSLQSSFSQMIGYSVCQQLEQISFKVGNEISVGMFIPKRDCDISALTKSTPGSSLVFINERPVSHKKILKVLHQQLAETFGDNFSSRKFAICLITITVSPCSVDVNLEPNKTRILIQDEDELLNEMQNQLQGYYIIPDDGKRNAEIEEGLCNGQEHYQHLPVSDIDEGCRGLPMKKRKLDEEPSPVKFGIPEESFLLSDIETAHAEGNIKEQNFGCNTTKSISTKSGENSSEFYKNFERNEDSSAVCDVNVNGQGQACGTSSTSKLIEESSLNLDCSSQPPLVKIGNIEGCAPCNPCSSIQKENEPTSNVNQPPSSFDTSAETDTNSVSEQIGGMPSSSDLEHLWDNVNTNDINELSMCLDALESDSVTSTQTEEVRVSDHFKGANLVGTEAWSMGHVENLQRDPVKGSCVLVGAHSEIAEEYKNQPLPSVHFQSISDSVPQLKCSEENSELEPQNITVSLHSEKILKRSPTKSPKASGSTSSGGVSPRMDSSLQSVSSQMGRRELAAFTKFAREIRPQKNPGISFTRVATMLTEKWQELSDQERERYEEIARETAVSKKVWKVQGNQRQLEWVKKLPPKVEKDKQMKSGKNLDRPCRREIAIGIDVDKIRAKTSQLSSMSEDTRQKQSFSAPGIKLIGRLEPSGTWIVTEKCEIFLLNHTRLQEVVVNHRLLSTHALSMKPSFSREQLNKMVLGDEAWKTLLAFPFTFDELRQTKVVSADIIVKNGFRIEIQRDNESGALVEVADALNYYGLKELKETLLLGRSWPNIELSEFRPLRVVSHIKSEAMRICRKSPSMMERTMVEELLEYWTTVMTPADTHCLHSKPILTPIYNIALKMKSC